MRKKANKCPQKLDDLVSVGPATVADLKLLGIANIDQLVGKDPNMLYQELCQITDSRHDPCVIDVFAAAIAQAEDQDLPVFKKQWSYWSKVRKQQK